MKEDKVIWATKEDFENFAKENQWLLIRTKHYGKDDSVKTTYLTQSGNQLYCHEYTDGTVTFK